MYHMVKLGHELAKVLNRSKELSCSISSLIFVQNRSLSGLLDLYATPQIGKEGFLIATKK